MKLVSYRGPGGGARVGIVEEGMVFDGGTDVFDAARGDMVGPLESVALLPPLPSPRTILGVGLNYADHAEESGISVPEEPMLFAKLASSVIGPGDEIRLALSQEVDYEAELGVVIGTRASRVAADDALAHVFGYTCVNDVSARDVQFRDGQWMRGKSLDTFCPVGPWIVTPDEIDDPQSLAIRCVVNGRTLQDSNTSFMIRSVAQIISFASEGITLQPGDLIATGTPAGVGFSRRPPVFLQPGDVVRVEIDGIGVLENPVVARS
ncbi:MAG TPA: fumarylacetoacetate hydrolase family protein [Acidimicrobiales bacterium]|nr:fumarylacetoacetate hydrolase family protein [Acidimicrobiales bacterium]